MASVYLHKETQVNWSVSSTVSESGCLDARPGGGSSKSLELSVPQFSHLQSGNDNITNFIRLL